MLCVICCIHIQYLHFACVYSYAQAPMDPHWFQIVQVSDNQDLAKVSVDGMPF